MIAKPQKIEIQKDIPELLDELWMNGQSITSGDIYFDSFDMRKQELLVFWKSRACTPEGERVRQAIEAYIAFEVQASEHPFADLSQLDHEACGIKLTERLTALTE